MRQNSINIVELSQELHWVTPLLEKGLFATLPPHSLATGSLRNNIIGP